VILATAFYFLALAYFLMTLNLKVTSQFIPRKVTAYGLWTALAVSVVLGLVAVVVAL